MLAGNRSMIQKKVFWAAIAILIFVFGMLLLRNSLLAVVFGRVQKKILLNYHLQVNAATLRFTGMDEIEITHVTIQPEHADTLAHIEELVADISVLDLFSGRIWFDRISAMQVTMTALDTGTRNNVAFLRTRNSKADKGSQATGTGLLNKAIRYQQTLLKVLSTGFEIRHLYLTYTDSVSTEKIFIPALDYNRQHLQGSVIHQNAGDTLVLSGEVIKKGEAYRLLLRETGGKNNLLPFFSHGRKMKCAFDELEIKLAIVHNKKSLSISAAIRAEQLKINQWRIASSDVLLPHVALNGQLKITDSAFEIDSATTIQINHITAGMFFNYQVKPDTAITASVRMPFVSADTFFNSLPKGMFSTLEGISCTGSLAYQLYFHINTAQPDSLMFSSGMERKNFSVRHYGKENYTGIAEPFVYKAYDKKQFVRTIEISPLNPNYAPLNTISPFLVKSVLQSEDPSFMLHRGFLPEAIRESIIKNYKEKRFARGGSTISMQLVKNVFLSRDKTISRKAEEALIVYLIENLHLVSKERMLEVYLNIIEWGPNVYGIGEAARFYFAKKPSELSLPQSIFLAGIIPAPKYFKYQFDKTGKLKPYLSGYFHVLSNRMVSKGWVEPMDTFGLVPDVQLNGSAIKMILPDDSIPDTGIENEE